MPADDEGKQMEQNRDLEGRVALVTGGGGGIGGATVMALAASGAAMVVADKVLEKAQQLAQQVLASGGKAMAVEVDVTDPAQVDALFATARDALGPVDVLVNVAGGQVGGTMPISRMDIDGWDATMRLNLYGPMMTCRAALPSMIERRWGRIVNIGSASAHRQWSGAGAYSVAKSALPGLTKLIARENASKGITANVVVPAVTDTPGTRRMYDDAGFAEVVGRGGMLENPMHVVLEPKDLAAAIRYLCCESGRYVTGQTLHVNGGSFMP